MFRTYSFHCRRIQDSSFDDRLCATAGLLSKLLFTIIQTRFLPITKTSKIISANGIRRNAENPATDGPVCSDREFVCFNLRHVNAVISRHARCSCDPNCWR